MALPVDTFIAPPCTEEIELLYQDDFILLINKPSGLLSLSGKNPLNLDSVHFRLRQQFPEVSMVHRLDFGTSGIMCLALQKSGNASLTKQFQDRTVVKTYIAMLAGQVESDEAWIELPIGKDRQNFPVLKVCHETGRQAQSHYRVLERLRNPMRSRVLFTPRTGRTHQLRIHSREIGHPIMGCDLYGSKSTQAMSSRLLLHALTLEFDHPVSNKRVMGECPCPF